MDDYQLPPVDPDLMAVLGIHYLELRHFVGDLVKKMVRIGPHSPVVVTLTYRHGHPHLRCTVGEDVSWVSLSDDIDHAKELARAAVTLLSDRVDGNLVFEEEI